MKKFYILTYALIFFLIYFILNTKFISTNKTLIL